jgi:hypothetical protein
MIGDMTKGIFGRLPDEPFDTSFERVLDLFAHSPHELACDASDSTAAAEESTSSTQCFSAYSTEYSAIQGAKAIREFEEGRLQDVAQQVSDRGLVDKPKGQLAVGYPRLREGLFEGALGLVGEPVADGALLFAESSAEALQLLQSEGSEAVSVSY